MKANIRMDLRTRSNDPGAAFGRGISHMDMEKLEDTFAQPRNEREFRDRALFFMMSRTGLRAREVLSLKWSSMIRTPESLVVFSYTKKGGKTAYTVPGDEALAAVREYHVSASIESEFFFLSLPNRARGGQRSRLTVRSLERLVSEWGERLNIRIGRARTHTRTGLPVFSLHPHSFRHTAVQRVFDTMGSMAAMKLASHSSMLTTSRHYTKPYFDGSSILRWNASAAM